MATCRSTPAFGRSQKDGDLVAHATGLFCEGCGKPVVRGQFVNFYDDVGELHVDCANPWAKPPKDDLPIYVLLGDPLALFRLSQADLTDTVEPPATPRSSGDDIEGAAV